MATVCQQCGKPVNPNAANVMRQVTGWERVRAQGGGHGLTGRRETGRYLCPEHGALLRAGVDPDQGTLM